MLMLCETGKISDIEKYHLKWLGSQKFDGCRCLVICDENINLIGRSGSNYTSKFPEIVESLKGFKGILDGEIICDTFDKTSSRVHTENKLKSKLLVTQYPAKYMIFDVLQELEDLRSLPLFKRLIRLKEIGEGLGKSCEIVENSTDLIFLHQKGLKEGFEGLILKNPLSVYENRRSFNWLKVKFIKSRDIVVAKYEINPAGIRVESKEGIACQISGEQHKEVLKELQETGSCLIEVNYLNETASGLLRQPTFKCKK